ncbi:MAG TPA: FAD-dependent oxidoreductase [archaeon]|nr:FAD-dependent oxidoreductase [archaeon]
MISQKLWEEAQLVVIGAGIVGANTYNQALRYGAFETVQLIERRSAPGLVNSYVGSNSGSVHPGDTEMMTPEKAKRAKRGATMTVNTALRYPENPVLMPCSKMVLGVTEKEREELNHWHRNSRAEYPTLQNIGIDEISRLERRIVAGRKDRDVTALHAPFSYAADYGALANLLVEEGSRFPNAAVSFGTELIEIKKSGRGYVIRTSAGEVKAGAVIVATGARTLGIAQRMGYAKRYGQVNVAGDFIEISGTTNVKTYLPHKTKLPMARIHADPYMYKDGIRIGPSALLTPFLERDDISTISDYLASMKLDFGIARSFAKMWSDPDTRSFITESALYNLPFGRRVFLKEAQLIYPSLRLKDLGRVSKGGVRPQIIDKENHEFLMGEIKIPGEGEHYDGIEFVVTPSPGATNGAQIGEEVLLRAAKYCGVNFSHKKLVEELATKTLVENHESAVEIWRARNARRVDEGLWDMPRAEVAIA